MWEAFVEGFSRTLHYFYIVTAWLHLPNYGLAIILFTVGVKVVLFPLTARQVRSLRVIQELQPQIRAIQEKYRDNPEKAQRALMELYKKAGANPFSGCLPLLIQMPILFALFSALRDFFDPVRHPPYVDVTKAGFLWIGNLGRPDPVILPILTVIATFFQQYVTTRATGGKIDPNQRLMLIMMPLFVGWLARTLPAGLALYWVTFSLVGVFEQWLLGSRLGFAKERGKGT